MDAGRHAERQNPPCSRHSLYIVAQHACRGRSQLDNSATRVCTPPGATRLQQPGGPLNEALHPVPQQVQSRRTLQAVDGGRAAKRQGFGPGNKKRCLRIGCWLTGQ